MTVRPNQGERISPAALQSPTMKQTSATCTLHFYYNMFGNGMFCFFCIIKCIDAAIKDTFVCESVSVFLHANFNSL